MTPKIIENGEFIEVIGHYDDKILCAKMTLLADLYSVEHRDGYAKFKMEDKEKLRSVDEKLEFVPVSYFYGMGLDTSIYLWGKGFDEDTFHIFSDSGTIYDIGTADASHLFMATWVVNGNFKLSSSQTEIIPLDGYRIISVVGDNGNVGTLTGDTEFSVQYDDIYTITVASHSTKLTFDLSTLGLASGTHRVKVWPKGDGVNYSDAALALCKEVTYTVAAMPSKGDLITIENKQYRVLNVNGSVAELLAMYDANESIAFNANASCFLAGTKIALADGTYKNIEDVTYNDRLKVWDFDNGNYGEADICWITARNLHNYHYYQLTFDDGTVLRTTGTNSNHKVYNVDERFFKGVDKTQIGDRVFSEHGIVTVVNKEYIEEDVLYYNLITSKNFDCFADGILTSDRYGNMYPIDDNMMFVKDAREVRPYSEFEAVEISQYWYNNLRLGEMKDSIESIKEYIKRLESQMLPREEA